MNIQIGRAIFNRKEYEEKNSQLITINVMRTISKVNHWKIEHNEFKTGKWYAVFAMMMQADVQKFDLKMTYFPSILKSIAHIHYPTLMELNLEVNEIDSIEPLTALKAPILQKLILSNNRITSIRPLAKMNLKYLTTLALDGNEIIDFYPLTRANFPKKMDRLLLENWDERRIQVCGTAWVLKSRSSQLTVLNILAERHDRLKDKNSLRMIRQKYRRIEIK